MDKLTYTLMDSATTKQTANFDGFSDEAIQNLVPGDSIKIGVKFKKVDNTDGERFWITFIKTSKNKFVGRIDNDLIYSKQHGLKYRDLITIEKKHILDTLKAEYSVH